MFTMSLRVADNVLRVWEVAADDDQTFKIRPKLKLKTEL